MVKLFQFYETIDYYRFSRSPSFIYNIDEKQQALHS